MHIPSGAKNVEVLDGGEICAKKTDGEKEHGPDLFTIINILGIDESIKRIKRIEKI